MPARAAPRPLSSRVHAAQRGYGKGEARNIEIAPFDPRDVPPRAALNGVRSGLVVGFLGREIARNLIPAERSKMYKRGFYKLAALNFRKAHKRNAGNNGMRAAGKKLKHAAGIVG